MHKYVPTAEDRCIVQRWTWRVLIVYGAVVLAAFGLVSLNQHFGPGSKGVIAADVTAPTASRNQSIAETNKAAATRLQTTP
jgi:hypothetical protein